jgi:hypothetical protein
MKLEPVTAIIREELDRASDLDADTKADLESGTCNRPPIGFERQDPIAESSRLPWVG